MFSLQREGDFNNPLPGEFLVTNRVCYRHPVSSYLLETYVELCFDGKLKLTLVTAPQNGSKVLIDCKEFVNHKIGAANTIQLPLDVKSVDKIIELYKTWEAYDGNFEKELNQLCRKKTVMHVIPEKKSLDNTSSELIKSSILFDVMNEYRRLRMMISQFKEILEIKSFAKLVQYGNSYKLFEDSEFIEFCQEINEVIEKYQELVSHGRSIHSALEQLLDEILQLKLRAYLYANVDPNQFNEEGKSLIYWVSENIALTILLEYQANPFIRDNGNYFSAYDVAFDCKDIEKLKIYSLFVTKPPQKSLSEVKYINSTFYEEKISTDVILKSGEEFQATIKNTTTLGLDEKKHLVELHAQTFKSKNFIKEILDDKTNFAELVSKNKKIIGFNVYQMVWSSDMKQPVFHWMYIVRDKNFKEKEVLQNLGFLRMYTLRLEGFIGPTTYQGYKVVRHIRSFPKNSLPGKRQTCIKALQVIYGDSLNLTNKGSMYVQEQDYVEMKPPIEYRETFFQKFVLGYHSHELDENKMIKNNRVGIAMFDTNNKDVSQKIKMHQKLLEDYLNYTTAPLRSLMMSALPMWQAITSISSNSADQLTNESTQIHLRSKL